jgi:hypothetical protein
MISPSFWLLPLCCGRRETGTGFCTLKKDKILVTTSSIPKTVMKNNPDAEQSVWKGWSDIGGFRPNLTQPSRIVFRGNLTESDGEDVLSTTVLEKRERD